MLKTRVLAALIFAPALLYLVYLGGLYLAVALFVLALLSAWEYLELTLGGGKPHLKVVGYLLAALLGAAVLGWLPASLAPVLLPAAVIVVLTAVLLQPEPISTSGSRAALVVLGALYCGGLLPYLALLRGSGELGLGLAMMALFCTWGADTGAYFVGRFFGKHKLYPKISPAKTIEGGVGGLLTAVAVAFLIRTLFAVPLLPAYVVAVGALAAVLGVVGDLVESMLKRSVGAKDSSRLIPGHGGVLDRFDAVMFVAPGLYVFLALALS